MVGIIQVYQGLNHDHFNVKSIYNHSTNSCFIIIIIIIWLY